MYLHNESSTERKKIIMNRKLYDISEDYMALDDMLYDPEMDEQTIRDTMEAIFGEFQDKAENYAKIILGMEADKEALKAEEKRLNARRTSIENRQKLMKQTLMENMQAIGKKKIQTALFTISISGNAGKEPLVIDGDINDIPGRFLIPQPPVINNDAVRSLLAEKQVDWAHLEPRGEHLRIR